jgi:BirA family biotin operon repressor/biotin-[acetyl-CoA-carboxylase] ligase
VVTEVLGLRVALAVCAVLDEVLDRLELRVKWPNDLVLGDRKLGGVICEARWQGDQAAEVAVGVGLNVANPLPPELRASATTLAEWRSGVSPQLLIEPLALAISRLDPGLGVLPPAELESLQRRDWLRGRRLREPEIGVALGIESDGALRVGREDGQIALLRSGHVVLEDAGPRRP